MDELYRSSSGSVLKARCRRDGQIYVLKQRLIPSRDGASEFEREISLLTTMDHPNLIKCHGQFTSGQSLYIILEYADQGDLAADIARRRRTRQFYTTDEVLSIFRQLASVVEYLHARSIVHRDIKPLNILMFSGGVIKLADLGVSRRVSTQTVFLQTFIGTPLYLAPELVDNMPYTEKVDVWAMGVVLYEMCCLSPPFNSPSILGLMKEIAAGKRGPIPDRYPPTVARLIDGMLQHEARSRPGSARVHVLAGEARERRPECQQRTVESVGSIGEIPDIPEFIPPSGRSSRVGTVNLTRSIEPESRSGGRAAAQVLPKVESAKVESVEKALPPAAPKAAVPESFNAREERLRQRQAAYNKRLRAKQAAQQAASPVPSPVAAPAPKPAPAPRPVPTGIEAIMMPDRRSRQSPRPAPEEPRRVQRVFKIDKDIPIKPQQRNPDLGRVAEKDRHDVVQGMGPGHELEMLRRMLG
ncbi:Protein kinase domain [Carpediemonas membranifera]|uniref:non-specific serine/threonine protein kinase n=1 Tax=Carpediemonas membranifera TaxID=201153 RepID=A0A8J6AW13_9EUKA|nr:Protein kinase domain [Carpediemonas membranifera]|eukprot:KAG9395593.1 Protein kinase domain [Carpediemonas membranifera]